MGFTARMIRLMGLLLVLWIGAPATAVAQNDISYGGDIVSTKAFMADLAELYQARRRGTVTVELMTATEAIKQAAAGEIDVGGSSRTARMDDRQERRVAVYPIVWDALVVIVNRANPIINISLEQLHDIYAGELTNWSEIGGEDEPIRLYVHEDPLAGVNYNLSELLLGDPSARLARSESFPNTQAMEEAVEAEPWSLAVTTYSNARTAGIKILSLEGRSASVQSIQAGDYALYLPLYLAMREDGRNRRQVREFLRFAASAEAKRVLRRNGVVPYTDGLSLASKQLERAQLLEQIRKN